MVDVSETFDDPGVLEAILYYLYMGSISERHVDYALQMLPMAKMICAADLEGHLLLHIHQSMSVDIASHVLHYSAVCQSSELADIALRYIANCVHMKECHFGQFQPKLSNAERNLVQDILAEAKHVVSWRHADYNIVRPMSPDIDISLRDIKIAVIGDHDVGVTAFIIRVTQNVFDENNLWIDDCVGGLSETIRKQRKIGDSVYMANLEDCSGIYDDQQTVLLHQVIRENDGFLLLFDVTRRSTFTALTDMVEVIKRVKDVDFCNSVVLVANKIDTPTKEWNVTREEMLHFAKEEHVALFQVSCKNGCDWIMEALDECIVECVLNHF